MVDRYHPRSESDMRESEDGEYVNWQDWLIEHGSRVTAQHRVSELESKLESVTAGFAIEHEKFLKANERATSAESRLDSIRRYATGRATFSPYVQDILKLARGESLMVPLEMGDSVVERRELEWTPEMIAAYENYKPPKSE